jgi:hypothetical protein
MRWSSFHFWRSRVALSWRCVSSLRGVRVRSSDDLVDAGPADAVFAGDRFVALAEPGCGGDLGVSFGVRSWHSPP